MEKSIILSADILDILFEGRNKNYGAYELRKTYQQRIMYALLGTVFLCLLFIGESILANAKKNDNNNIVIATLELENYKKEENKPELPKPEPLVQTRQYVIPVIVEDDKVKPEEEMKEVIELENSVIGKINQDGKIDDGVMAPPVEKVIDNNNAPKVDDDIDKVFTSVQIPAQFDGGQDAWRKFLLRNLNSDIPNANGAPAASYTVIISFIVDRSGIISDVKAENDPGFGTKAEAIRVIQKGPNWKPAIQNGIAVNYRHKQSITFRVEEQ
jgi:periplasmic protein TonB